jgi:hypothetical protein
VIDAAAKTAIVLGKKCFKCNEQAHMMLQRTAKCRCCNEEKTDFVWMCNKCWDEMKEG